MIINSFAIILSLTCMTIMEVQNEENPTHYAQLIQQFSHLYSNKFVVLIKPDNDTAGHLSDLINIRNVFSRSLTFYSSIFDFATFFTTFGDGSNFGMTTIYTHIDSIRIPELNKMLSGRHNGLLTWLCEIPSNESTSKLRDVYAPVDSKFYLVNWVEEGRAEIREMYNLPRRKTQEVRYLGEWDDKKGLTVVEKDWAKRRENLNGVSLKYLTFNEGFAVCQRKYFLKNYPHVFECVSRVIWNDFGKRFNFTTEYLHFNNPDEYKLILDTLSKGICDTGQFLLYMRSDMNDTVYYLWPRIETRFGVSTAVPRTEEIKMSSFLKPCSGIFWMVLALWLTIAGIVLALLVHITNRLVYHRESSSDHIRNFYVPFQAICLQGSTLNEPLIGIRMVLLMCYIIPVIFMTAYSGKITSSLAHPQRIPFKTIKEFEKNGEYRLTAVKNFFAMNLLQTDPFFEKARQLSLVSKEMPADSEQASTAMCTKKISLVSSDFTFSVAPPNCEIYYLDDTVGIHFAAMAVSPHFPFREPINRHIQKIISVGLSMKEYRKEALNYFGTVLLTYKPNIAESQPSLEPASLKNLMPLFAILGLGVCLSGLVLMFELWREKRRRCSSYCFCIT